MNNKHSFSGAEQGLVSRRRFLDSSRATIKSTAMVAFLANLGIVRSVFAEELPRQELASETDFENLAAQYSLAAEVNYLNHASIGTIPKPVQKARLAYLELCESNPWLHIWGEAWTEPVEEVRRSAAEMLGCKPSEIAMTHNTTEMFNTLANGFPLEQNDEVLFSSLCHAGASIPFLHRAKSGRYLARRFEFPYSLLPGITTEAVVDAYAEQIKSNTRVVIIPHLDNTLGVRYPVRQLAKMARTKGVEFVAVDAAQTVGMLPINCTEMGVDAVATSGHKWLGGPKGTGLAYINERIQPALDPLWVTWGQREWAGTARKYEDYGTRNSPEVLTLGNAIGFSNSLSAARREQRLKDLWTFTRDLVDQIESLQWNSPTLWELSGSLYSIRVKRPADELANQLFQQHGYVVRSFTNLELNNLRVSPNVFTTKDQIRRLVELIS